MHGRLHSSDFQRFSTPRKLEILKIWRHSQGKVLMHNVTRHEILQWDALEKAYGPVGLYYAGKNRLKPEQVRDATSAPELSVRAVFSKRGWVQKIEDPDGVIGAGQLSLTPAWTYAVVRALTKANGICTIVDFYHHLWSKNELQLPDPSVIKVHVTRVNHYLKSVKSAERIKCVHGRGYYLASSPA
jgi:hypothetical protein